MANSQETAANLEYGISGPGQNDWTNIPADEASVSDIQEADSLTLWGNGELGGFPNMDAVEAYVDSQNVEQDALAELLDTAMYVAEEKDLLLVVEDNDDGTRRVTTQSQGTDASAARSKAKKALSEEGVSI